MGLIAASRYKTLKSHLKHWAALIDKNTQVKDLKCKDCEGYYEWSNAQAEGDVKQKTVHSEQVTINGMIKWLYMQNETYIEGFDFKKLKKIDDAGESVISQTLASEGYNRMTSAMRKVSPNAQNELQDLRQQLAQEAAIYGAFCKQEGRNLGNNNGIQNSAGDDG